MTTAGYIVFVAFIASPFVPLLVAAFSLLRSRNTRSRKRPWMLIVVLAVMSGFAVAGFFIKPIIGPDYSMRRYITIYAALAAAVVVAIAASRQKDGSSKLIFLASALLAAVWCFHAAISSVA